MHMIMNTSITKYQLVYKYAHKQNMLLLCCLLLARIEHKHSHPPLSPQTYENVLKCTKPPLPLLILPPILFASQVRSWGAECEV